MSPVRGGGSRRPLVDMENVCHMHSSPDTDIGLLDPLGYYYHYYTRNSARLTDQRGNYAFSCRNLSSVSRRYVVVLRRLRSLSVILILPIHIFLIEKINHSVPTVTVFWLTVTHVIHECYHH